MSSMKVRCKISAIQFDFINNSLVLKECIGVQYQLNCITIGDCTGDVCVCDSLDLHVHIMSHLLKRLTFHQEVLPISRTVYWAQYTLRLAQLMG